jgi:exodeoxyribonuclease-1
MSASLFFYDLETSGFNPREARIMQFAGQRTDLDLKPVGQPVNVFIQLTPDVLPEPDAVLVTGITPQRTLAEGLTEVEFLKLFQQQVAKPDTIFVGFNNIRFDDEFMRFLLYRNFYDPYEWQWRDGASRWDLLDVLRMTRALRPEGILWPFTADGKPTNRLELLTAVNKLDHEGAHDALADTLATISVARLVHEQQPGLFRYLLEHRDKKSVKRLVETGAPFVYTSGHYSSQFLHTSAVMLLARHVQQDAALVYDLRFDPTPFLNMPVDQLSEAWKFSRDPDKLRLPVKTLKYNRAPAVAPLGVIKDPAVQARLQIDLPTIAKHRRLLQAGFQQFAERVAAIVQQLDEQRAARQTSLADNALTADERLYDDFIGDSDKTVERAIRAAGPEELGNLAGNLKDERLRNILPLYKARNFSAALSSEERVAWEEFCRHKLLDGGQDSRLGKYFKRLQELAGGTNDTQQYLLEELKLYGESIIPVDAAA